MVNMNLVLKLSLTPNTPKNITCLHSPANIAANESFEISKIG